LPCFPPPTPILFWRLCERGRLERRSCARARASFRCSAMASEHSRSAPKWNCARKWGAVPRSALRA
jgi:hypothetical protein